MTGPLAIRLIKPPPIEVNIHGHRHPVKYHEAPQSIDPTTGKIKHRLIECDIDLLSEKTVRKIINIIRPHLASITIDCAFIISKPEGSDIEEPSCCVGLWRIDKVDFERAALFPEKTIDEAAVELKEIMSRHIEGVSIEVAAS